MSISKALSLLGHGLMEKALYLSQLSIHHKCYSSNLTHSEEVQIKKIRLHIYLL
jgi:hypothetical protein